MEQYGSSPVSTPDESEAAPEEESVDEENKETDTAIVSNKILSPEGEPLKEGDEIVVRVVKNYGDESEIEYAPKEGGGEETTEEPMSDTASDMAALAAEGE